MTAAHLTSNLALALEVHALRCTKERLEMKMSILQTIRRMDVHVGRRCDEMVRVMGVKECLVMKMKEMRRRMSESVMKMVELVEKERMCREEGVLNGMDEWVADGCGTGNDNGQGTGNDNGYGTGNDNGYGTGNENGHGAGNENGHGTGNENGHGTGNDNGHCIRSTEVGQVYGHVHEVKYIGPKYRTEIEPVDKKYGVFKVARPTHKNYGGDEKQNIRKNDYAYENVITELNSTLPMNTKNTAEQHGTDRLTSTRSSPHLRNYKRLNEYASFPFLRRDECKLLIMKKEIERSIEMIRTVIYKEMDVFVGMMAGMGVVSTDRRDARKEHMVCAKNGDVVLNSIDERDFLVNFNNRNRLNDDFVNYGLVDDAGARALREEEKRVVQHMHDYIGDVKEQKAEECRFTARHRLLQLRERVVSNILKYFEEAAQQEVTRSVNAHGWVERYGSKKRNGKEKLVMKMKEEIKMSGDDRCSTHKCAVQCVKLKIKDAMLFMQRRTLMNYCSCLMRVDEKYEEERMEVVRRYEQGKVEMMRRYEKEKTKMERKYEKEKLVKIEMEKNYEQEKIKNTEIIKKYEEEKLKEIDMQRAVHEQKVEMMHEQHEVENNDAQKKSALVNEKLKTCSALKSMALSVLNNKCVAYTCIDIERNLYRIQSNIFYAEFILLNAIHQSLKMVVRSGTIENDERLVGVINESLRAIERFNSPQFVKVSVELEICKRYVKDLIKIKKVLRMFSIYSEWDC
ncbi:hypothetical protein VCUG_00515 [Vavraia culicis subsp. floridensis]|uniref:Uncharacterized protein n=1 Tax=Vavraia culicis (isolate floridensis) TaxID=948595 RepID=L2GX66_VAVCU|nr:uncharacterized protein VCUG_00515 [Vavraia culicis subsp. floridensis]ELA47932.1 hypothetical protein VCUG_00515 [Vavraia culicis subsp. floridensis]